MLINRVLFQCHGDSRCRFVCGFFADSVVSCCCCSIFHSTCVVLLVSSFCRSVHLWLCVCLYVLLCAIAVAVAPIVSSLLALPLSSWFLAGTDVRNIDGSPPRPPTNTVTVSAVPHRPFSLGQIQRMARCARQQHPERAVSLFSAHPKAMRAPAQNIGCSPS